MFKLMIRTSLMALLAAILAGGNAHAGKLYAVSASAEPSNAVLYRYDVTGPNDHRCEAIDPSTGWSQPELFLPILPSEAQQTSPISGGSILGDRLRMDDRSPIGMLAKNHGLGRTLGMVN